MLPSLIAIAAITAPGAPIPKDTIPNPTGPAPRILALKSDGQGTIWVCATIYEKRKIREQVLALENGQQVVKMQDVERIIGTSLQKSIGDFGGKFTTVDGMPLTTEQASSRIKDGATVLATADGKPIDPSWLRIASGDTVVMVTDELTHAYFLPSHSILPSTPAPRLAMLTTDDKATVRAYVNPDPASSYQGFDEFGGFQNGVRFINRAGAARIAIVNGQVVQMDSGEADAGGTKAASDGKKALEDIRFDAYDLTGKLLPKSVALQRLKAGGLVLMAGDNRFPDPQYLKAFRGDPIVLVSAEFTFPPGIPNPYDPPMKSAEEPAPKAPAAANPVPLPAIAIAPAPAGAVRLPIAPVPAVVRKQ